MKDVFKNMRGAGLVGLLLMVVVFAVSVMLAGGLYFAKISRDMELNELNDEISAHRTIAPVVASLKARQGCARSFEDASRRGAGCGPSQHAVPAGGHLRRR